MTLSVKDKGKLIRAELKEIGYNSRQVKVRTSTCTFSGIIDVIVVDYKVDVQAVKNIVNKYEEIQRDEITHEILLGGNTYIHLTVECNNPEIENKANEIYDKAVNLEKGFGAKYKVTENIEVLIFREGKFLEVKLIKNEERLTSRYIYGTKDLAKLITSSL